jgi:hypothetical protein
MKPIQIDIDDLALARNQHNSEFLHVLDLRDGRIHMVEEFGGDLTDAPVPDESGDEGSGWVDPDEDEDVAGAGGVLEDCEEEEDDDDEEEDLAPPPGPDDVPTSQDIRTYPDLFMLIETRESTTAFRDMEEFVESLAEGEPRRALCRALRLPRPFRAFKDTLYDFPNERDAWFSFSEERQRADAIEWLTARGIPWCTASSVH